VKPRSRYVLRTGILLLSLVMVATAVDLTVYHSRRLPVTAIGPTAAPHVRHGTGMPSPRYMSSSLRRFVTAGLSSGAVPRTISSEGVAIVGPMVGGERSVFAYLKPATPPNTAISAAEASSDALSLDNGPGLSVTNAVFASVTLPGSIPPAGVAPAPTAVIGMSAWVVTVSSPTPGDMPGACAGATETCTPDETATANILILNPTNGAMLGGFFT